MEQETLRHQMTMTYTMDDPLFLKIYGYLPYCVIGFLILIPLILFSFVKDHANIDAVPYFGISLLCTVVSFAEISLLTKTFGYPKLFTSDITQGSIGTFLNYYTQPYVDIEDVIRRKVAACHEDETIERCFDLLPLLVTSKLLYRYIQVNPTKNKFQAVDFFDNLLKEKKYMEFIGWLKFHSSVSDLENLGVDDFPFSSLESDELTDYLKGTYRTLWFQVTWPWILFVFLFAFHPLYKGISLPIS